MPRIKNGLFALAVVIVFLEMCFPQYANAQTVNLTVLAHEEIELTSPLDITPVEAVKPKVTKIVSMTAYSSTVDQCDGDPFITASGSRVRDGIVAANFVPLGTKIKIPALYGDKIFVVEDRMNRRYQSRVDIWMNTRQEALNFGVKKQIEIEILPAA